MLRLLKWLHSRGDGHDRPRQLHAALVALAAAVAAAVGVVPQDAKAAPLATLRALAQSTTGDANGNDNDKNIEPLLLSPKQLKDKPVRCRRCASVIRRVCLPVALSRNNSRRKHSSRHCLAFFVVFLFRLAPTLSCLPCGVLLCVSQTKRLRRPHWCRRRTMARLFVSPHARQKLGIGAATCATELAEYAVDMPDDKGTVSRTCGAGGPAAWQLVDRLCSTLLIIAAQRMKGHRANPVQHGCHVGYTPANPPGKEIGPTVTTIFAHNLTAEQMADLEKAVGGRATGMTLVLTTACEVTALLPKFDKVVFLHGPDHAAPPLALAPVLPHVSASTFVEVQTLLQSQQAACLVDDETTKAAIGELYHRLLAGFKCGDAGLGDLIFEELRRASEASRTHTSVRDAVLRRHADKAKAKRDRNEGEGAVLVFAFVPPTLVEIQVPVRAALWQRESSLVKKNLATDDDAKMVIPKPVTEFPVSVLKDMDEFAEALDHFPALNDALRGHNEAAAENFLLNGQQTMPATLRATAIGRTQLCDRHDRQSLLQLLRYLRCAEYLQHHALYHLLAVLVARRMHSGDFTACAKDPSRQQKMAGVQEKLSHVDALMLAANGLGGVAGAEPTPYAPQCAAAAAWAKENPADFVAFHRQLFAD